MKGRLKILLTLFFQEHMKAKKDMTAYNRCRRRLLNPTWRCAAGVTVDFVAAVSTVDASVTATAHVNAASVITAEKFRNWLILYRDIN